MRNWMSPSDAGKSSTLLRPARGRKIHPSPAPSLIDRIAQADCPEEDVGSGCVPPMAEVSAGLSLANHGGDYSCRVVQNNRSSLDSAVRGDLYRNDLFLLNGTDDVRRPQTEDRPTVDQLGRCVWQCNPRRPRISSIRNSDLCT